MTETSADSEELKLAAIEAVKLLVQSQLGAIEKSKTLNCKRLLSPERIERVRLPFSEDKEACVAFDTYVSLSNLLVKFFNASQLLRQSALATYYSTFGVLLRVREEQQRFNEICNLPLMLTAEEEKRLKKKYIAQERGKYLSLAKMMLQVVQYYVDDFISKKENENSELDKVLIAPVTNPRLLSKTENLDVITPKGDHIGPHGLWYYRDAEDEFRENFFEHYDLKEDVAILSEIRNRISTVLHQLFKDYKKIVFEINPNRYLTDVLFDINEAIFQIHCVLEDRKQRFKFSTDEEKPRYIVEALALLYINASEDHKKEVYDYIFGFCPLELQFVPYETDEEKGDIFQVSLSLLAAEENYGDSVDSFAEFLDAYSEVLTPIFNDRDSNELWEKVKELGAEKAYSTRINVGEMEDEKGESYCHELFSILDMPTVSFFKKENPKDPRQLCIKPYFVIVDRITEALEFFKNTVDKHESTIKSLKEIRALLEKKLFPICRHLLAIQNVLTKVADAYDLPELNNTEIACFDKRMDLEKYNQLVQTIYLDVLALDKDRLKYKEDVLQCFRLIDICDINPNDSQLEKHLENCKKTPFSIEAQATLNKLGDFLQNVSIPEEEPVTLA